MEALGTPRGAAPILRAALKLSNVRELARAGHASLGY